MPELPEVETMRRGVLPVVGATIADVRRERCRLRPILIAPGMAVFKRRAVGQRIDHVARVGKRVVLELSRGDRVVLEPRMTGLVLLADPPDREHRRLRIELCGSSVPKLLFWDRRGLGSVRLFSRSDFDGEFGPHKIGPDALVISPDDMRRRLALSRREIKVALLDQKAVAGIGNLYASELLHLARIDPRRPCGELAGGDWRRLHAAMLEVLHAAIAHEGSTLSDGTYRNVLNQAGGYQNLHRVYDRAGERCPSCRRDEVVRIVQAQRSTFFCPRCQRNRSS